MAEVAGGDVDGVVGGQIGAARGAGAELGGPDHERRPQADGLGAAEIDR